MDKNSPGGRAMARAPTSGLAANGEWQLFLVERRLPKVSEQQLAVLQAALSGAASRFSAAASMSGTCGRCSWPARTG